MTTPRIAPLTEDDLPAVHATVLRAFADYPLPMRPSEAELRALLRARGATLDASRAAFVDERMVGVWMTAVGEHEGATLAYTVFTGVVPEARGRGIAAGMFDAVVAALRDRGVGRIVHEVLVGNDRALRAYRRMGFATRRDLVCLRAPVAGVMAAGGSGEPDEETRDGLEVLPVGELDLDWARGCRDWPPTWPCGDATVERAADAVRLVGRLAGDPAGYAVLLPPQGGGGVVDVPQIAVTRGARRRGVATAMLQTLAAALPEQAAFRVLNVDAAARGDLAFWRSLGAREFARQHEMEWRAEP